ncbi:unnamed protein product [Trichobilharzia szidati]|nr:unnamed protein product [Trichobilharzia szidati]
MGIRGLWSYVNSNNENFVPYELHNEFLIIDGENFATHCYRKAAFRCQYGGEYLIYKSYVESIIEKFRLCRVEPIFVFGGCHPKEGSKLNTLLKRSTENLKKLSTMPLNNATTSDSDLLNVDILPRLCRYVLVEILRKFSIRYTACEREADLCVAQLSIYLNCPVTSGDSDFFIYRPLENNQVYNFIPLSSFSFDCKRKYSPCAACYRSGTPCSYIQCSLLNKSGPFYKLQYPLLPIFAVLCGNDMASDIRLPSAIVTLTESFTDKIASFYQRRIHAIFNWLLSFHGNVEQPLTAVLSLYNDQELDNIIEVIRLGISEYVFNSPVEDLVISLGLTIRHHVSFSASSTSTFDKSYRQVNINSHRSKVETGVNLLKTLLCSPNFISMKSNDETSIFYRWPKELTRRFKQLELAPSMLDSMYVRNGSVCRITIEDLTIPHPIHHCASSLQIAQYGLILGLEKHLNACKKLCGIDNDYVIEYCRKSCNEIVKKMTLVKPIIPPRSNGAQYSFLLFFSQFLRVNLDRYCRSSEMQGLAVLLTLWFKSSSSSTQYRATEIRQSPVGLAFACCTIAVKSNCNLLRTEKRNGNYTDDICMHINDCTDKAKSIYCQNNSPSFCVSYVHQLNELQTMAVALTHLVALLDVLCPFYLSNMNNNSIDHLCVKNPFISFYPLWMLFSSGRLLYWISRLLQNLRPNDRFRIILDEWLPRLLIRKNSYNEHLRYARDEFIKLFTLIDNLNK